MRRQAEVRARVSLLGHQLMACSTGLGERPAGGLGWSGALLDSLLMVVRRTGGVIGGDSCHTDPQVSDTHLYRHS